MTSCVCDPKECLRGEEVETIGHVRERRILCIQVLLLGTKGAGKSTFLNQLKIINGETFSEEQTSHYHATIVTNIITSVQNVVQAMTKLEISYSDPENEINSKMIMGYDWNQKHLDSKTGEVIQKLWRDIGFQECFSRQREYYVMESIKYYITERLDDVCSDEYTPTYQDILHCRFPACGVEEHVFSMYDGEVVYQIVAVGAQRTERLKWVQFFDKIHALIFLTAISDYDQVLQEDKNMNCLIESRHLFLKIIDIEWLQLSSTILFLNKIDLFNEKIINTHLGDYIEEYTGPRGDAKEGYAFMRNFFLDCNRDPERCMYAHDMCATDTENTRVNFTSVGDIILNNISYSCL